MNNFFGTQYSQEDLQRQVAQRRNRNVPARTSSMSMVPNGSGTQMDDGAMDMTGMMGGGDSLDDIIMQNNNEMRRQSIPQGYSNQDIDRRASMMEFGSGNGNLNGYQFGQSPPAPSDPNMRRQSAGELDIAAGFPDMSNMSRAMNMAGQPMGFSSSMQGQGSLTINTNSPYPTMSPDMMGNMMGYAPMGIEGMSEEDPNVMNSNAMNMFSPTQFSQQYGPPNMNMEPMAPDYMMQANIGQNNPPRRSSIHVETTNDGLPNMPNIPITDDTTIASPTTMNMNQSMVSYASPVTTSMPQPLPTPDASFNTSLPTEQALVVAQLNEIGPAVKQEPKKPNYNGIYSTSGFDMLRALMKVVTRKNPEIELGKVDLSCAFVVCDVTQYDCPIIYISDIFEALTGYNKHEIKGQNCRFLQSPEGKVEAGAERKFSNSNDAYYLKNRIEQRKEAQRSIINYRKGGQPFTNLLTMIPITGEDDASIKYYVGFQVDVLVKPTALDGGKNSGGHYTIDYSQDSLPKYIWQPPERRPADGGQTVSRDDVSTVLNAVNTNTESELTKRMWDKVLLENTDDVVHVLSLKGLFLYLSPSSRRVLEYDASELVGTALSSVCHPSDIVPVTRELKDTSTGASVNVVFRIRRKKSGYTWFESHGSLCVEQGKGRKCIILVGRERPVYAIHRRDIDAAGGIGENEMWTKLSTSGMFLFVSSNVRTLLDRSPDDLIGTSVQALMRAESRVEFSRSLEKARTGKRVTHKHDILNRKGLVLQAQTTLYPGDASEGQKPTFLVAQTRLLKSSRNVAPAVATPNSSSSMSPMVRMDQFSEESTPMSVPSNMSNMSSAGKELVTTNPSTAITIPGVISQAGGSGLPIGSQDLALASEDNIFDELKTTRCTSWQFELRQMEKSNRLLAEELAALISNKKKRKRRKGNNPARDCANCHTRVTPEWRRGPSGQRDLCNSCGLRWAKQTGRVSPRTSTRGGDASKQSASHSTSPVHSSPLHQEVAQGKSSDPSGQALNPNLNLNKGDGAAVPGSLGGRSTAESMPIHKPSLGFREGGQRGITNIDERDERGA